MKGNFYRATLGGRILCPGAGSQESLPVYFHPVDVNFELPDLIEGWSVWASCSFL